jgi:hypothetical protein
MAAAHGVPYVLETGDAKGGRHPHPHRFRFSRPAFAARKEGTTHALLLLLLQAAVDEESHANILLVLEAMVWTLEHGSD